MSSLSHQALKIGSFRTNVNPHAGPYFLLLPLLTFDQIFTCSLIQLSHKKLQKQIFHLNYLSFRGHILTPIVMLCLESSRCVAVYLVYHTDVLHPEQKGSLIFHPSCCSVRDFLQVVPVLFISLQDRLPNVLK